MYSSTLHTVPVTSNDDLTEHQRVHLQPDFPIQNFHTSIGQRVPNSNGSTPIATSRETPPSSTDLLNRYQRVSKRRLEQNNTVRLLDLIGLSFIDNEDNTNFQISDIVTDTTSKSNTFFIKYHDSDLYDEVPLDENLSEYTPFHEMYTYHKDREPSVKAKWITIPAEAHSIDYQLPGDENLNLNPNGTPISVRSVLAGPERDLWLQASGKEISKLIDMATIVPKYSHEQPIEEKKYTSYYNPKPKVKRDINGTILRSIRGTFGGNKGKREGVATMSQVADDVTINLFEQSILADRVNGLPMKAATIDLPKMYLHTRLPPEEYGWMIIDSRTIPEDILQKYSLHSFIRHDYYILFQVQGALYGMTNAGRRANQDLIARLEKNSIYEHTSVPGLFDGEGLQFVVITDDFLIKYIDTHIFEKLQTILNMKYPGITTDLEARAYNGKKLEWNLTATIPTLRTSMPTAIPKILKMHDPLHQCKKSQQSIIIYCVHPQLTRPTTTTYRYRANKSTRPKAAYSSSCRLSTPLYQSQ